MGAVRSAGRAIDPSTSSGLLNVAAGGIGGGAIAGAAGAGDVLKEGIEQNLLGGAERDAFRAQEAAALRAEELAGQRFEQIVTPGLEIGQQAQQQQAALSGALGPEAQQAAFTGFQESPGTAFLREQGLREISSQAAVTGQGGGNRLRALTDFSQGLALQDLSRQQQQLGQVAGQGISLAGTGATLTGLQTGGITAQGAAEAGQAVAGSQAIQNLIGQGIGAGVALTGG